MARDRKISVPSNKEFDLRELVVEILGIMPQITNGREQMLDLVRLAKKIVQKLDVLKTRMCGNDLFEHVMSLSVTDDSELYDLFQRIGSFVEEMVMEDSLADTDRVRLTDTCEHLLEALSSAPKTAATESEGSSIEPKTRLQELYGFGPDSTWDEIIEHAEKKKQNVKRLTREVFRFKRALKLAHKSLESWEVKYARIEGLDCQEKDEKSAISYTMIGMRKILSFMEESTKDDWSEENVKDLGFPEEKPSRKSHLEQKHIQLQGLIIEALGFLMVGHGSTGNSSIAADRLFNRILVLSRTLGINP